MRGQGSGVLGLVWVLTGALLGVAFVTTDGRVFTIPIVSLLIVTMGVALIVMRVRRLGAFGGAFGMPRQEARIRDHMLREAARAVRHGRPLSVVVLRDSRTTNPRIDWSQHLRLSDDALSARGAQTVLLLPETDRDAARQVVQRVEVAAGTTFDRMQMLCIEDVRTGEALVEQVATIVRGGQGESQGLSAPEQPAKASVRT